MGRACRDPPPQVREVETGPHRRAVALSKGRETGDGQARVPSPQHRHSPEEVSLDPEGDRVGAGGGIPTSVDVEKPQEEDWGSLGTCDEGHPKKMDGLYIEFLSFRLLTIGIHLLVSIFFFF